MKSLATFNEPTGVAWAAEEASAPRSATPVKAAKIAAPRTKTREALKERKGCIAARVNKAVTRLKRRTQFTLGYPSKIRATARGSPQAGIDTIAFPHILVSVVPPCSAPWPASCGS